MISPVIFPVLLTIGCILTLTAIGLRALGPRQDERAVPLEYAAVAVAGLLVVIHMLGGVR